MMSLETAMNVQVSGGYEHENGKRNQNFGTGSDSSSSSTLVIVTQRPPPPPPSSWKADKTERTDESGEEERRRKKGRRPREWGKKGRTVKSPWQKPDTILALSVTVHQRCRSPLCTVDHPWRPARTLGHIFSPLFFFPLRKFVVC